MAWKRFGAILLLFASLGPPLGGASHLLLMALSDPRGTLDQGLWLVWGFVALSYGAGLAPALVVGAAVAWRGRRGSSATLPFALAVVLLAPVAVVGLLVLAFGIGSGDPILDEDPVWRQRQLRDVATAASLLVLHSMPATIGCWLLARRWRLA